MKISIWQQFSSNHSSDFAWVGTFTSVEQATTAADELRNIVQTIANWWAQFERKEQFEIRKKLEEKGELPPPEEVFRQKYGVQWFTQQGRLTPIDWIEGYTDIIHKTIFQYQNIVIIENEANTWSGGIPFDTLLKQFGAILHCDCESNADYSLIVNITCLAPDDAVAEDLVLSIRKRDYYLRFPQMGNAAPGRVIRKGNYLVFRGLILRTWVKVNLSVIEHFHAIIEFLEGYGCTVITCEFAEIREEDLNDFLSKDI